MRFSFQQPFVGGALRDATKNGCVGDYLWSRLEQIYFTTEFKNHKQNRSTGVLGNFFTDNVRQILPKCGKAIILWVLRMSGLDPEFGIKMIEIKVAEINAPLN